MRKRLIQQRQVGDPQIRSTQPQRVLKQADYSCFSQPAFAGSKGHTPKALPSRSFR
jgi:hypothetical protein